MDYNQFIPQLLDIAKRAGDAILEIYHQSEGIVIDRKADDSPLTEADRAANAIICEGLEKLSIVYPIISEENKAIAYEERKNFEHYWLVDPLDGTKEFIKRNGEFTVNIALVNGNRPILGVVYAPCLEEMYWAVKGEGAYCKKSGETQKLQANQFQLSDANLQLICSRSHLNEATQNFVADFKTPELVSKGSSLKFLLLAKGEAHIYPRLAPTMEWDTGAAQIILEESGGKVIRADDKTPLSYNKENLLNPYFIAYGGVV